MTELATEQTEATEVEAEFTWRPSPLTLALATCAMAAFAAAVIWSRWQLITFAAPLMGVLVSISWQRPASKVHAHAKPGLMRCFESEQEQASVWVSTESADIAVTFQPTVPAGMELEVREGSPAETKEVVAQAQRWGRYPVTVRLRAVTCGGLLVGTAEVEVAEIFVFPLAPPQATGIPRTELPDRLGTHLTRHVGPGVEYADIRPYLPGDQLRTVNWAVSARRGSLHVTERLTDRVSRRYAACVFTSGLTRL